LIYLVLRVFNYLIKLSSAKTSAAIKSILLGLRPEDFSSWPIFDYFNNSSSCKPELFNLLYEIIRSYKDYHPTFDIGMILKSEQSRRRFDGWDTINYSGARKRMECPSFSLSPSTSK